MSDIRCAVCSEPWNSYGVRHGDMLPWESDLFSKGAGCPCCKGERPAGVDSEAADLNHVRDALDTEDPHAFDRLNTMLADATPTIPVWERPIDPIVRACACGVTIFRNVDEAPTGGPNAAPEGADLYWRKLPAPYWRAEDESAEWADNEEHPDVSDDENNDKGGGTPGTPGVWCPHCVSKCDRCCEIRANDDLHPDPADEYRAQVCMSCLEEIPTCGQCGGCTENDTWTSSEGDCEYCARLAVWADKPGAESCELVCVVKGKDKATRAVDSLAEDNPGVRYVACEERDPSAEVYEATETA